MNIEHVKKDDQDIYIYSKQGMSFSLKEYIELLNSFLSKENVKLRYISYKYEGEFDYTMMDTIEDMNDIQKMIDILPFEVEAYFVDDEKSYKLAYTVYRKDIIELSACDIKLLNEAMQKLGK